MYSRLYIYTETSTPEPHPHLKRVGLSSSYSPGHSLEFPGPRPVWARMGPYVATPLILSVQSGVLSLSIYFSGDLDNHTVVHHGLLASAVWL